MAEQGVKKNGEARSTIIIKNLTSPTRLPLSQAQVKELVVTWQLV